METFFPTGETLIALERETLRKILNTGAFTDSDFSDLIKNANAVYYGNSGNQSPVFAFHCHFAIEDNDDVRRVDVGARIVLDAKGFYKEVSYFFAISGLNGNPKHILRKVHFDFEPYSTAMWLKQSHLCISKFLEAFLRQWLTSAIKIPI